MKPPPLLCELHAHTSWSDGALTIRELVDLYGRSGFDVLAVTDHTVRDGRHVHEGIWPQYRDAVEAERERAFALYGLLLIAGLELTYDDPDPLRAAHAVAVGLHEFVGGRTARFAAEWRELRGAVDRFELVNRHEAFPWVADACLPAVASGDFHRAEHLATWKTMLPCAKHERAVVASRAGRARADRARRS